LLFSAKCKYSKSYFEFVFVHYYYKAYKFKPLPPIQTLIAVKLVLMFTPMTTN